MRALKSIAVVVAIVAVGCLVAAAADRPSMPDVREGEPYLRSDIWKNVDTAFVPLPGVIQQLEMKPSDPGIVTTGPVASANGSKSAASAASFGAASIPGVSLRSFMTPQERTTNEIRKTIRRLG